MMKHNYFPFVALYGMEKVKEALLLALISPCSGGILISGRKGTGKSTVMRAARELVDGPWADVPISVTEDRLFGTIDMEKALSNGKRELLPGLIHNVHGGIMYIDDVNLFREDLLATLLEIKDQHLYFLERDGISIKSYVDFSLMAVMNPEEGTLSNTVLDHFGLFVEVEDDYDEVGRTEIIKRSLAFEKDGIAFAKKCEKETVELKNKICHAKEILSGMEVSSAMIQLAAVYALKAHVSGHRADIYLIETAKAVAAWNGRSYVLPEDIEKAAEFVLPHRMRKNNEPNNSSDYQENESVDNNQNHSDDKAPEDMNENSGDSGKDQEENSQQSFANNQNNQDKKDNTSDNDANTNSALENREESNGTSTSEDKVEMPDWHVKIPPIWIDPGENHRAKRGTGKRSLTRTSLKTGRYVRVQIPKEKTSDIAFDATLRAAAPYQKLRKHGNCTVMIEKEDIRSKVREKRIGNILLLVVDSSGSMGVAERMKTVKGVIFKILMEAYQKRDRVGLIAFRKNEAEVLLPVTRSVDFAKQKLEKLPVGGKTPLAKGLMKAQDVLDMLYRQDNTQEPVVILITDGRATSAVEKNGNPVEEALQEAGRIGRRKLPTAVIDTESGFIKLGLAKDIAKKMGASYFHMDKLTEEEILRIWKSTVVS